MGSPGSTMSGEDGTTSFSVMLGPAPHLDGRYTVFGCVITGKDVMDKLLQVPCDSKHHPVKRLEIQKMTVLESPAALEQMLLAPARDVVVPKELLDKMLREAEEQKEAEKLEAARALPRAMAGILAALAILGFVGFLLHKRLPPRALSSLLLANVLVASFGLLVWLVPEAYQHGALAAGLFLFMLGLFKLMGKFE